ncbi:MAG: protein translocase subunit SecD [Alphaproteobacteria bacterium]|nr:protein translocase subunit SecD [Alphaproteobacteria bacterium]
MLDFSRTKIILILLACLVGIVFASPNFLPAREDGTEHAWLPTKTVNLGLDLRGGSHLLLGVEFDVYLRQQLENLLADIRVQLRAGDVGYKNLRVDGNAVSFDLRDAGQEEAAKDAVHKVDPQLDVTSPESGKVGVAFSERTVKEMRLHVIEQSIEIVRRRVDETGTREPTIQRQGDDRILLQVPGLDNPEKLKSLLGKTANMTFHLVDTSGSVEEALKGKIPLGDALLPYDEAEQREGRSFALIKKKVMVGGDLLLDSRATVEQGSPVVSFRFNSLGAKKFGETTSQNVGQPFAIVLDGVVISSPVIREPILGGRGIISGNFTVESANDLALLLRAGALPAPLKVLEERTVGPSLGQDSIEAGKIAALAGVALVMLFMVVVYGRFGVYSNIALIMNMLFILAAMSLLQATMTLPGIAGIVLTMGMAVDANVLIFERVREELRLGKTPRAAMENGYRMAFGTILDSNITTLLAAMLLYYFGTGPVKGFAVTLSIGITASMFSAIMLTRLMVARWMHKKRPKMLAI